LSALLKDRAPGQGSVDRWRFSPRDFENSGGFESHLAGKKYFWRSVNFWRISGGFEPILHGFVFVWRILAVLESLLAKQQLFSHFFFHLKNSPEQIFLSKYFQKRKKKKKKNIKKSLGHF
jgi:hypothetical protein